MGTRLCYHTAKGLFVCFSTATGCGMDMDITVLGEESHEIDRMAVHAVMSLPPGVIDRSKQSDAEGAPQLVVTASSPEGSVLPLGRGRDSPDKGVIPVAPTEEPVLMHGNLQKLGKVFKGWHQRYFEIQGRHMYHYKTSTKHHCLGDIDLSICFYAGPTNVATFGHPFEIRTTQRVHVFAARTYDEMHRWVEVIEANMGTPESEEVKPKQVKVKRWQSIKSTFSLQPRRHPQDPTTSLGGHEKRAKKVDRNKSFMQRLKNFRHRSNQSSDDDLSPEHHHQRPKSMSSQTQLEPPLEHPPTPRSLPNTPIIKKRDAHQTSPPASPLSVEVFPISSSTEALKSPSHASSTSPARSLSPEVETGKTSAIHQGESKTGSAEPEEPLQLEAKGTEPAIPEFLNKRFVWDEIKELLESLPERSESPSYQELPPEETGWEDKPTGMEQLREFLAVCA